MKSKKFPINILQIFSALCIVILTSPIDIKSISIITGFVIILYFLNEKEHCFNYDNPPKKASFFICCGLEILFITAFYLRWLPSNIVLSIATILHIPKPVLILFMAVSLATISIFFVMNSVLTLSFCLQKTTFKDSKYILGQFTVDRNTCFVCILTAIGIITICSRSSFLYPLNDWVDSNCFFTVGKSILNGLVPYKDLFEQKGPFLYFLHSIAWMISEDSFLGVYFLEIIAASIFLYYSYKSVTLLINRHIPSLIPVMALCIYASNAFQMGDSAEEFCLPFIAHVIWRSIKTLTENSEFSLKHYFITGIFAGCVFWTKFTLVGFYIGWFILPAIELLRKRDFKKLCTVILTIASGVFTATIPYIIYFGIHGAIGDWLKVYIYDNLFTYSLNSQGAVLGGLLDKFFWGVGNIFYNLAAVFLLSFLGILGTATKEYPKIGIQYLSMLISTFFVVYVGGRFYPYYSFVFSAFIPFGISIAYKIIIYHTKTFEKILTQKSIGYVTLLISVVLAFLITPNRDFLGERHENLPQYQFKEIIKQKENPTLLNYGFLDGGFYTVCNIIPNCKAFCELNNPLEEMYDLQNYYVDNGLCDFIVTRNEQPDFEQYTCIAQTSYPIYGVNYNYYLYELKE